MPFICILFYSNNHLYYTLAQVGTSNIAVSIQSTNFTFDAADHPISSEPMDNIAVNSESNDAGQFDESHQLQNLTEPTPSRPQNERSSFSTTGTKTQLGFPSQTKKIEDYFRKPSTLPAVPKEKQVHSVPKIKGIYPRIYMKDYRLISNVLE